MMMLEIYGAAFVISILMVILLAFVGYRRDITYYLLVFVAVTVSNLGFYIQAAAQSMEAAVIGHRLMYIGGVFIPMMMLCSVMQLCKIKVKRGPAAVMVAYCLIVLYYAFQIDTRTDYYRSIDLGTKNGITYIIKEYGPMHNLFLLLLFGFMAATLGVILYSFFKKKDVSRQIILSLLVAEVASIGCYAYRTIFDGVDWTAVAYVLDEILILFFIQKISMYEVSDSIAQSLMQHSGSGYLIFDRKKRFIACDDTAKEYLPELWEQRADTELSPKTTPILYKYCHNWLEQENGSYQCLIKKEDRVLKCSLKPLVYGKWNTKIGHIIEIIDDTQQQKYVELLNHYNADLENEVRQKTAHINMLQEKMVLGMADMIEDRDSNTGGHIKRTSEVICIFTKELEKYKEYQLSREFLDYVVKAAPMHDLGKIAVDDKILRKPGKFTAEEFEEMKKHAAKGAEIVTRILNDIEDIEFIKIARNVAHYHHEKWNGQGYPRQLSGEEIPIEARIMALADVFDALVSKRCYKIEMSYDQAFKIIEESLGSHFDPELGEIFLQCRPQLENFYDKAINENG